MNDNELRDILNCNWVTFNEKIMLVTKVEDIKALIALEKKVSKRGTFITRLERRARYLASKVALD